MKDFLLVGGIALIIAWMMFRLRSKQRNRPTTASPKEILERHHQARGLQGQLEDLMIEVEDLTKRFSLQLDAKARRLEHLLSEADQRIAELRNAENNWPENLKQPLNQTPPPPPPLPEDPLAESVYRLADTGLDAHTIAMQLDEHVGKVELILALRSSKS